MLPSVQSCIDVMRHHKDHQWSLQGFGMLRTYLGPSDNPKLLRLNIWDDRYAVPNVSTIHDHPWHFESSIVGGAFCNVRYDIDRSIHSRPTHSYAVIRCGEGGGMEKSPVWPVALIARTPEIYVAHDYYAQRADEIHQSIPARGTVTINERHNASDDGDHARVFWPFGTPWVDAEPREATPEVIERIINYSLGKWF